MNPFRIIILTALFPLTAVIAEDSVHPEAEPSTFSLFSFFDEESLDSDAVFDETLTLFEEDLEEISNEKIEEIVVSSIVDPTPLQMEASSLDQPQAVQEAVLDKGPSAASLSVEQKEPEEVLVVEEVAKVELAAPIEAPKVETVLENKDLEVATQPSTDAPKNELISTPKENVSPTDEIITIENEHAKKAESSEPVSSSLVDEKLLAASAPLLNLEAAEEIPSALEINLRQVFAGSPLIYTILLVMSMGSVFIWLYNLISLKYAGVLPETVLKPLRIKLNSNQYDEALSLCTQNDSLFCKMIATGIHSRRYGVQVMLEAMRAEGKRATTGYWQRMGLLNDVAIIAPMIGLLGTVLGMFYAFYDLNRTTESVTTLFDGLGISVGTTVAGLVVAILSMILQSTAKYRIVRQLARVENEAYSLASLIENKTPGGN